MRHFALIPGAIEAMPSRTWVYPGDVIEKRLSRRELRAALSRAEAHLRLLRTQLNPDMYGVNPSARFDEVKLQRNKRAVLGLQRNRP